MNDELKNLVSTKLKYENDMKDVHGDVVVENIIENTKFTFSFVVLLVISSIVSTLGLLQNNTAIIIGGMIISPLMWPLMKISAGISFERKLMIRQAIVLLILSIFISVVSAFFIALISPVKHLNSEILARSTPTILDIFVALAAGVIAALALVQKKISSSLAGVAIATSLMPPLSVAGIGLSLYSYSTFYGGALLFLANVVSIIFASILVFLFTGVQKDRGQNIQLRGILTITVALIITSVPLYVAMKNYSFKINSYDTTERILKQEFAKISRNILVQNISTSMENLSKTGTVVIEAELLVPEDTSVNYQQQEQIIAELEQALEKKIDLKLRVQNTISLVSEDDLEEANTKTQLTKGLKEEITKVNSSITIDSIATQYSDELKAWVMEVVVRSDPSVQFSENARADIEQLLSQRIERKVNLNIDVISRIKLISQPDMENDQIKREIEEKIALISSEIDLSAITLTEGAVKIEGDLGSGEGQVVSIVLDLRVPEGLNFRNSDIDSIAEGLQEKYQKNFIFKVNVVEKKVL